MVLAERYSIAFHGLKPGLHDFDFEVGTQLFEAYSAEEIKGGVCKVHVTLERAETQMRLAVTIAGDVVVACDRCLEDCSVPVDYEGVLTVKISETPGEYDGEVMWLLPGEDEIDLGQYIYESILLSLPYQRVHADGACNPEMLEKFRIVSDAEFAAIEARAAEEKEGMIGNEELQKLAALKAAMEREE